MARLGRTQPSRVLRTGTAVVTIPVVTNVDAGCATATAVAETRGLVALSGEIAPRSASHGNSSGTTTVVNAPPVVVDGDFLIAFVTTDIDGNAAALTAPAGWTQTGPDQDTAGTFRARTFYKIASSEPASYTFGAASGSSGVVKIVAFTNVDTADPFDVAPVYTSSSTNSVSVVAPDVTVTDGASLVCGFTSGAQGEFDPPADMVEIIDQAAGWTASSVCHVPITAGATGTRTSIHSVSDRPTGMSLVLRKFTAPATNAAAQTATATGLGQNGTTTSSGSALPTSADVSAAGQNATVSTVSATDADAGCATATAVVDDPSITALTSLTIDASSPPYVENETGFASLTTAAFTPPAGSLLVMAAIFDTGTNTRTITPSTVTGSTSAWTTVEHFVGTNGLVAIFYATVLSSVSTTVRATFTVSNDCAMKTWVFTGADNASPIGAHGTTSITTNPQTVSYTASRTGSIGVLCEESFNGVAVTISNTTLEGSLTTSSAGMIVRQTTPAAGLTTQSYSVAGTTNSPALAYAEIMPVNPGTDVNAQTATATGDAQDATTTSSGSALPTSADATGLGQDVTPKVSPEIQAATATGLGQDATAVTSGSAQPTSADATGLGQDVTAKVSPEIQAAAAVALAQDATAVTSVVAPAGAAGGSALALDGTTPILVGAQSADATGLGLNPDELRVHASAGSADAAALAQDATGQAVGNGQAAAQEAAIAATAENPTILITTSVDVASATVVVDNPAVELSRLADAETALAASFVDGVEIDVAPEVGSASATTANADAGTSAASTPDTAQGTADPIVGTVAKVEPVATTALITATTNNAAAKVEVDAFAETAQAAGLDSPLSLTVKPTVTHAPAAGAAHNVSSTPSARPDEAEISAQALDATSLSTSNLPAAFKVEIDPETRLSIIGAENRTWKLESDQPRLTVVGKELRVVTVDSEPNTRHLLEGE